MNLLIVRHAHAEALPPEGGSDADRPLSDRGRQQSRQLAATLHKRGIVLGTLFVSPLVRAVQTGEELLAAWEGEQPEVHTCEALAPEGKARLVARSVRTATTDQVTLIGHMPDLGRLLGWLIGDKRAQVHFAKAGAAFVESPVGPGRGHGTLSWLITPLWFDAA